MLWLLLLILSAVQAIRVNTSKLPLPVHQLHQFSLPTALQSLAIKSNGDMVLTTVVPNGSLYYVSNTTQQTPTVTLIHTFSELNAVTGIIETEEDVFVFLAGNLIALELAVNGTFGVWELDLRPTRGQAPKPAIIRELVHVPDGGLLYSIIPAGGDADTYLVSDGTMGLVWRVNLATRTLRVGIQADGMRAAPWATLPFGIGTMEIHKGYLYWINTFTSTFYRIPIDGHGYVPVNAKSEKFMALRTAYVDGFTFGPRGGDTIWAVTHADSRLVAITPDKKVTFVGGSPDQLTLGGCTMPRFGQRHGDERTLYIVTDGSLLLPINGTLTEGGKLVSVDTTGVLC